jgi:hypothetical protein
VIVKYFHQYQQNEQSPPSVMDFYFTDADYADYYVDYGPDYSSAYFYFDTSKCKANLMNINIFCLNAV